MKLKNTLFLCLFLVASLPRQGFCSTDSSCLSVEVLDMDSHVLVLLKNNCLSAIEIDGGLGLGGRNSTSPMTVDIYDQEGRLRNVKGELDSGVLSKRVVLQKQQVFGSRFAKEMIKHYYSVDAGLYSIEATYLLRDVDTLDVKEEVLSGRRKISL